MKHLYILLSVLAFPFFLQAQNTDSLATSQQIDSLIKVSRDLTGKRDFEQALAVNAEAERVALEVFGRVSAEYGNASFNRGRVMAEKNDFPEAEKWYLEAKEIREIAIGKEHVDYAQSLHNLAILYRKIGNYDKAESLHLEAKAIRGKSPRKRTSRLYLRTEQPRSFV
jgi:tetratricopeptide (TPR) repeat protein